LAGSFTVVHRLCEQLNLTTSDYRLSADGSAVTLTRLSDNKVWSGADVGAINTLLAGDSQGFTLASTGPLVAGSSYLIQPARDAARGIAVNPAVVADTRLLALAGPLRTSLGASNTGTATVSAATAGPGYAAAAALPMTLTYQNGGLQNFPVGARVSIDGATPVLISAVTDSIPYTSGAKVTLVGSLTSSPPVGFSFTISGMPNNGDTFAVSRNSGATADGRNALALAQLQTQDTMSGKTDSFLDSYSQLVSAAGSRTRQVQVSAEAQQVMLEQAEDSRESFSGVNLDEEAANLIRYQQAYQAAAKALQVAASLFDTILDIA
jgi:flagellar hook-associated protein 1 FlgK